MTCYWCGSPPPCLHVSAESQEEGLLALRAAVHLARTGAYPTRTEQLKIRWVRWFHAPADATETWCNCGRRYPCQTRRDVIG